MKAAPFPADESERLLALKNSHLLDTLPEPEFDELVQLAAELCECPVALISLVDENRQWFKARHGIEMTESERATAFCGYAILDQTLMMVPDAKCDKRFAENPLVQGQLGIRFYAGMPLITSQGYAIGTLCVVDYKARELNPLQQRSLSVLAHQVVRLIELRRVQREQIESTVQIERTRRCQNELNALDYDPDLALEEKLALALDILLVYTSLDGAGIYELQDQEVFVRAELEVPDALTTGHGIGARLPLAGGTVELILAKRDVLAWDELELDHPARLQALNDCGIKNLLGAPYLVEGRQAGVVTVFGCMPASQSFSELQREFLQMFATWLGSAIERERFQMRQQELQEIHSLALSSAQAGLWVLPDLNQEALWWSERTFEILGYTPEIFTPTRSVCRDMVHPDDREHVQQDTLAALTTGKPFRTDMRMRCRSGRYIWCQLFGTFTDSDGRKRMTGVIREIDAERRMSEQLEQSEALLQKMSKLARIGAWVLEPGAERARWSDELFRIHDLDPKQEPPTLADAMRFYSPEMLPEIETAMAEGLRTGQEWELDLQMLTAQNRSIWVRGISQAVRLPDGSNRLYGVVQDITHRKAPRLQRQRLQDYQERLAALSYDLNLSREQMMKQALDIALDYYGLSSGFITQVRGEVFEILALRDQRLQAHRPELKPGKTVMLAGSFTEWLYHHEEVLSLDDILAESTSDYNALAERFELRSLIGQVFRVRGERFGPVVCYAAEQSQTPFTELEREFMQYFSRWLGFMLERSSFIEHLQQLNISQNHLLAVVAHDLRNPLAAIQSAKWMIDRHLAKGHKLDTRLLGVIENSCVSANTLIQELLELAEVEQAAQRIVLHPVILQDILSSLTEQFEGMARKKEIQLLRDLPEVSIMVAADVVKLRRAIENLLSNAIKFTPISGTVRLSLIQKADYAVVTVEDTGIGIPPKMLKILFDKFTKAGRPGTAGERSHGLGMHICREIVSLHKGQLTVESVEQKGTCFYLQLPLAALL